MEVLLCGLGLRPTGFSNTLHEKLDEQDRRIDEMHERLEGSSEQVTSMKHAVAEMMDELEMMRQGAGRLKAKLNVEKAHNAVLHLADAFDALDKNGSNGIDVAELRRGLGSLGMDSHSPQAAAIIERYTDTDHKGMIDAKAFSILVRDIHLLLTFDRDGSGTLDAEELRPALEQLGLRTSERHCAAILRTWDADRSGKLDLLEFTDLVRSLQTFSKYDTDASGDIDINELRPALRRLGLPADTATANSILMWYDSDESGRIELHEFAVLARDINVFQSFDLDSSGTLDAKELLPALTKLGVATSSDEVQQILHAWDANADGHVDLLEFSALVRDLQIFAQFDRDGNGAITAAELRAALRKLGVNLNAQEAEEMLDKYDDDHSGLIELPEFRRLAEDLPSLVGRKASNLLNFDSFVKRDPSFEQREGKAKGGGPSSVVGGIGDASWANNQMAA